MKAFEKRNRKILTTCFSGVSMVVCGLGGAFAGNSVTFDDMALDSASGIDFERIASPRLAIYQAIQANGYAFPEDNFRNPLKAWGAPGVAVFDYDNDSDLDIYVTNGPGRANSLYSNTLKDTGELSFIDVASEAGVELTDQDSTGVCFGDIDNDGDSDLMVLSTAMGNTLFENDGNGHFVDISETAAIGGVGYYSTSCSMGDVNNDGLLDVAIANTYDDWDSFGPIVSFDEAFRNQDNQLFVNQGGNVFADVSVESGITNYQGISWVIALVDYDIDGDADIVVADDQGAKPGVIRGGIDTGYVRVYNNDGTGHFTDVTTAVGTDRFGAWMGLTFADYNSDGYMDIFASNIGDYMPRSMRDMVSFEIVVGDWNSGWFLGGSDGRFSFPGVGGLAATPFGWGAISTDYDNDADTDIVFHGGLNMGAFIEATNPGSMLRNTGDAQFEYDATALVNSTDHSRRLVMGVAAGDLNDDGFTDIVSVSAADWNAAFPMPPIVEEPFGGPFDNAAFVWPTFIANDPADITQGLTATGLSPSEGTLAVEINSADNGNNWVKVDVMGAVGMTPGAVVNRDGIGAVVMFDAENSDTVMQPVVGGASYASQDSLSTIFGLGDSDYGHVEIVWPGGVRNRLYNVRASEHIVFPEIPCSIDDMQMSMRQYRMCVTTALKDLSESGEIARHQKGRFLSSALKAFKQNR